MKDRWMNIGFEDSQLTPYIEPPPNYHDPVRYEVMMNMGFTHEEIENSLTKGNFDNITATYFLLEDKSTNLETDSQGSDASLRYGLLVFYYDCLWDSGKLTSMVQ